MKKMLSLLSEIVCFIEISTFGSSFNHGHDKQMDNFKAIYSQTRKVEHHPLRESPKERFNRLTRVYEKVSKPQKRKILEELQNVAGACDPDSSLKEQIESWADSKNISFVVSDPFQAEN